MMDAMKIEELADNIWRVRMARDGRWPESAMNRYGVIADMPVRAVRESLDFGKVKAECAQVGKGFRLRFPLEAGERVFGLGDVSRENIQRRPGRYRLRVENVTSYIPVPMAWTSRGWGIFVNTTFDRFRRRRGRPGRPDCDCGRGRSGLLRLHGRVAPRAA